MDATTEKTNLDRFLSNEPLEPNGPVMEQNNEADALSPSQSIVEPGAAASSATQSADVASATASTTDVQQSEKTGGPLTKAATALEQGAGTLKEKVIGAPDAAKHWIGKKGRDIQFQGLKARDAATRMGSSARDSLGHPKDLLLRTGQKVGAVTAAIAPVYGAGEMIYGVTKLTQGGGLDHLKGGAEKIALGVAAGKASSHLGELRTASKAPAAPVNATGPVAK